MGMFDTHRGIDIFAKGMYPYSHKTLKDKCNKTELSPVRTFHDTLNPLDPKDYEWAQKTWSHFGMHTMCNYRNNYLLSDSLVTGRQKFQKYNNGLTQLGLLTFFHGTFPGIDVSLEIHGCQTGFVDWPRRLSWLRTIWRKGLRRSVTAMSWQTIH